MQLVSHVVTFYFDHDGIRHTLRVSKETKKSQFWLTKQHELLATGNWELPLPIEWFQVADFVTEKLQPSSKS